MTSGEFVVMGTSNDLSGMLVSLDIIILGYYSQFSLEIKGFDGCVIYQSPLHPGGYSRLVGHYLLQSIKTLKTLLIGSTHQGYLTKYKVSTHSPVFVSVNRCSLYLPWPIYCVIF